MEIGIGLPNAVPRTGGEELTAWAREAERRGFTSLGTIDRLAYGNLELAVLAASAAVTERIRLMTSILLAPLRRNTALLAKQAASIDVLSGGRLVLGLAVGAREDDYEASGVPIRERGRIFDQQLATMRAIWAGEADGPLAAIGPRRNGGPAVMVGGTVEASFRRAARYGAGWIMGSGSPDDLARAGERLDAAWRDAGRDGSPRKMALAYYSLGPRAEAAARAYLGDYYSFLGEITDAIIARAHKDPEAVRAAVESFERVGCDELILFPCSNDPAQVGLLADAVL